MNSKSSIFLKKSETESEKIDSIPLTKCDVIESIPKNFIKCSDHVLANVNTEWRWRIFKFPNKKNEVVEISFKKPREKRMYINRLGEWVCIEINKEFDKFVIDEYYVYSN
jgi:hypothetical protein